MNRFLLWGAAAWLVAAGAHAETLVERGSYLVNAVMVCDGCHTPRNKSGFVMAKRFSGGSQVWDTPAYTVRGSNITPDPETGIGTWSDEEIKRALVEGTHQLGRPISPQMPFPFYRILTLRDRDAIVAYLRTVKPVRNAVQPPVYKAAMTVERVPGVERPFTEADLADPGKRGTYLGMIAHCMECHARSQDGAPDYRNGWGKGGYIFKGPFGTVTVSNITSHPTAGVGSWSDEDIRRALTQGVSRDGRPFKAPMARQEFFSRMTREDLDALVAWIRALPPLD
jgi:mono/diheme cytochrome c family protein